MLNTATTTESSSSMHHSDMPHSGLRTKFRNQQVQKLGFTTVDYRNAFVSGFFGLSTAFAVMHPLDTFKLRLQALSTQAKPDWNQVLGKNMWNTLRRGFFASVFGAGPQGGARLSTYELTKHYLIAKNQQPQSKYAPIPSVVVAAVLGDFASSIVKLPREIVTSRLQACTTGSSSFYSVCKDVYKDGGVSGFFRGFWSTTARDCPFMIVLFASYETMKLTAQQHSTAHNIVFGGLSGALAGFVTTPFDVIKTQIMTNEKGSASIGAVASDILRRRGLSGFLVGSVARSAWWFGICGIFFPIYENTKKFMKSIS